uniref:SYO1-like TPR repeats domain-containing protein n=1 Tax=Odontella aurita TaxID=265563 RepID=A0A7S4IAM8_9STRA
MDEDAGDAEADTKDKAEGGEAEKDSTPKSSSGKDDNVPSQHRRALDAWRSGYVVPIRLAVEVTANLCAGSAPEEAFEPHRHGGDEDDEMMMWDSDDEAKLQAESAAQGSSDEGDTNPRDVGLFRSVAEGGVPDRLFDLLRSVAAFATSAASLATGGAPMPTDAAEDLSDLLAKTGACLMNALANLPWRTSSDDAGGGDAVAASGGAVKLWGGAKERCGAAVAAYLSASSSSAAEGQNGRGLAAAAVSASTSVMAAVLRHRPSAIPSAVGEDDLRSILALLELGAEETDASSPAADPSADVRRDAVSMLGLLTSLPHSSEANDAVCVALLSSLGRARTENPAVTCEVLGVLMDLYGSYDDPNDPRGHEEVFRKRDALGAFTRGADAFRKRVREEERAGRVGEDEVEVWRECSLNAGRFVKYKKG